MYGRHLNFLTLTPMPIALGATTPNPNKLGACAYSSIEQRLMTWNGEAWNYAGHNTARYLPALANFSNTNYYSLTGGEPGVAAGGFGIGLLFYFNKRVPSGQSSMLAIKGLVGANGWDYTMNSTNQIFFRLSGITETPRAFLTSGNLGKLTFALGYYDTPNSKLRQYLNREQIDTGTTASSYSVPSAAQILGFCTDSGWQSSYFPILAQIAFRGAPTDAQIQSLFDIVRSTGDVPTTVPGATVTHRWSLRDTLSRQTFSFGQAAPKEIPDTTTGVAADTYTQTTGITVRPIDTATSYQYGVAGFSAGSFYRSADGKGLLGSATGFWGAFVWAPGYLNTNAQMLVHHSTPTTGWCLQWVTPGGLRLSIVHGGTIQQTPVYSSYATDDINLSEVLVWNYTGTHFRLYRQNSMILEVAVTGFTPDPAVSTWVGNINSVSLNQIFRGTWYSLMGGDVALTDAQIAKIFSNYDQYETISPIAGVTAHFWDVTQDVRENGGPDNNLPLTIKDRVGDAHMTRSGGWAVDRGGLRGLELYKPGDITDIFAIGAVNGYPGATTGFYVSTFIYDYQNQNPGAETYLCQQDFAQTAGYLFRSVIGANSWATVTYTGGNVSIATNSPGVGYHYLTLVVDPANNTISLYNNGVFSTSKVTSGTYIPNTAEKLTIGCMRPSPVAVYGLITKTLMGVSVGDYVPTAAEIAAASSASMAAGKIVGIPGKTSKTWSLVDDIIDAGNKPPNIIKERVGDTPGLSVIGPCPTIVKKIRRRWSYDVNPLMYGFTCPAGVTSNVFEATNVQIGNYAHIAWWITVVFRTDLLTNNGTQRLFHRVNAASTSGFAGVVNNGVQLYGHGCDANTTPTLQNTSVVTLGTVNLNKISVFTLAYDPIFRRLSGYYNGVLSGGGTVLTNGYTPDTAALAFGGYREGNGASSNQNTLFGLAGGNAHITHTDAFAHYQNIVSAEDIVAVPNKTNHLWSSKSLVNVVTFTKGSTNIPDQIGGRNMVLSNYAPTDVPSKVTVYSRNYF